MLSAPVPPLRDTRSLFRTRRIAGLPAAVFLLFALLCSPLASFAQTWMADISGIGKPTYVTLNGSTLYVSEHGELNGTGGGRILKYTLDGNGLPGAATVIATRAASTDPTDSANDGHFISPDAIVIDASGNLFIADRYLNRITKLSPTGTFMGKFGVGTVGDPLEMHGPNGVAIDSTGNLYITEHGDVNGNGLGGQQVGKYSISGTGNITAANVTRVWHVGSTGSGNGQFAGASGPYGVTLSTGGATVMVSDGFNSRVELLNTSNGAYNSQFPTGSGLITLGSSLDGSGALWIAESSSGGDGSTQQIAKINASTGASLGTTFGTLGSGALQFHLPFDVAVNSGATRAYVADWANSRVQVINLSASAAAPTIATTQPATTGTVGSSYSYQVAATGATTYTITTGSLPAGLAMSNSGLISGTPTAATSSPLSVTVQVSNGTQTASGQVTISVNAATTATPPSLPAGPSITSFSLTAATTGTGAHGTMTVAFDSAVTGVDQTDFIIAGPGSISGVTPIDSSHYGVNFNYTDGSPAHLQVAIKTSGTGITDGSSNAFYGRGITATTSYGIQAAGDITPPSVSSFTAGTPGASSVNFTLTFSAPVTGVSAGDFLVAKTGTLAATVNAPTTADGGTTWTIPVSFTGTGTLELFLAGGATTNVTAGATVYDGSGSSTSAFATIGSTTTTTPTIAATQPAPTGTVNATYSYQVQATNATSYTLISGTLPAGLAMNSGGLISGTPTAANAGTTVTVQVANGSQTASGQVTIAVNAATSTAPTIAATQPAPTGTVNATYSYQIQATNATGYSILSGALPAGLTMSTSGLISGTPTAANAGTTVTVQVSNGSQTASGNVTIVINAATSGATAPSFTNPASGSVTINGTVNAQITQYTLAASGSPAPVLSINTGTLPAGLAFNATTGVISGAPTASGSSTVTFRAQNSAGSAVATVTFNIAAAPGGPSAPAFYNPLNGSATIPGTVNASIAPYTLGASGSPTPTLSLSGGTLPGGISLNTATGVISGTPTAAGTSTVTIRAQNSVGSATANVTFNISVASTGGGGTSGGGTSGGGGGGGGGGSVPPPPALNSQTIVFLPAGSAIVGQPITLSATSSAGLSVSYLLLSGNATLSGNVLTPTTAGAVVVRAYNNGNATTAGASADATITAKTAQTISFVSPTGAVTVGQAITLGATSSAGLPISYSVVSGSATISGNVLTPTGTAALVIRASSAGNSTTAAASADVNFGIPQKAAQVIALVAMPDVSVTSGAITLPAMTSAGLPITYTVTGPATLSGNTLTLTGVAGTVTVAAAQSGSDSINPAATVTRTFNVRAIGQQVYFGGIDSADTFAVVISQDNTHGTFLTRLSRTGEPIVARFTLNADGSFSTMSTNSAGQTRTISGAALNGTVTARIAELNLAFTGAAQPAAGAELALAGLYQASVPNSASGDTYLVVGPAGQTFALSVNGSTSIAGSGTMGSTGAVNVSTAGATISATVDGQTGAVNGTVTAADGQTSTVSGLSDGVTRTDRFVNVSSRLRVTGGDASRAVIAGFVVNGTTPKQILVRAIGPGLKAFGVSDVLATPKLTVRDSTGATVGENDGWSANTDIVAANTRVGAFALTAGNHDSAVLLNLAPGAYTAQVSSSDNGIVLIEVYDASTGTALSTQQLVNISTRGFVGTGEDVLVAGFVVTGNAPKRVLIRGIGPSLTQFGVPGALADPMLKVYAAGSTSAAIAQNDNWGTAQPINASQTAASAADITAADTATGAFPLQAGSKDAAIVITLNPGNYSAVESGVGDTTGAGLIEVYEIPNL
jgi:hypothetical protein